MSPPRFCPDSKEHKRSGYEDKIQDSEDGIQVWDSRVAEGFICVLHL
jgi:hypothetical protein